MNPSHDFELSVMSAATQSVPAFDTGIPTSVNPCVVCVTGNRIGTLLRSSLSAMVLNAPLDPMSRCPDVGS